MKEFKSVAVIGLGYIGLPTAAVLAGKGLNVIGVDVKESSVEAINRGEVPFVEPDLGEAVSKAVSAGTLKATTDTPVADAYIVAVPTPFNADRTADLSYIEAAARSIAPQLTGDELVILESTSPPGATQHLGDYLVELRPDLSLDTQSGQPVLHVAHCPERVLPGRVMIELVSNDRIVGGLTREAAEMARDLYSVFCEGEMHVTDAKTAEMAKLVENSYRDVNIAFANELSVISSRLGIDVWELIELANHHPRVNILQPGPGVGGHCIAVDPWFIVAAAPEDAKLIRQARETNDAKPEWVINKVKELVAGRTNATVAALGLAFKADIDDLRESPAISIVASLSEQLPEVRFSVVEPHVEDLPRALTGRSNVSLTATKDAIEQADVVLLLVDHTAFKELDRDLLAGKKVIDTRGVWR
ncbi:UDP-N-acetyl-D-mannosamine dehydrogenase [Arthrobacter sp. BL-252-APC-1A]|uniref:UDP-N-acetyl-D-mannosamine dehydrogenase n=1 Tax=Arthrobacter sp. BL-252-APC-1A TaxID=2606622 RepID=UPI0012B25745|nr:UDP-N-acetyl-D-mannosamine dehydrogenase [Arthrobacter sp. BL-252-APC-1A]MSS00116.1 UDP-N-acetyl-D-mannosamine dehydrogenase [Arthrobacter sp. BL-252-APC-1A]